eukprot:gene2867-2809_t
MSVAPAPTRRLQAVVEVRERAATAAVAFEEYTTFRDQGKDRQAQRNKIMVMLMESAGHFLEKWKSCTTELATRMLECEEGFECLKCRKRDKDRRCSCGGHREHEWVADEVWDRRQRLEAELQELQEKLSDR